MLNHKKFSIKLNLYILFFTDMSSDILGMIVKQCGINEVDQTSNLDDSKSNETTVRRNNHILTDDAVLYKSKNRKLKYIKTGIF